MLHLFLTTKHTDTDADNGCLVVNSVVNSVCRGWIMEVCSLKFVKFVGCVVCSEEKMQRLLTKTRFIKWGRLRYTLCQAHRSIQGTSFRSTKVAGSILTIGGCGEGDCCNRRDVWRQWSHPCAANWETFLLIASTAAFILACLRCNLALFWKISLICSCCCSRFNIWLLRYRREAALFWRMARWARCCTFCLVDSFEFLDGRGGRE